MVFERLRFSNVTDSLVSFSQNHILFKQKVVENFRLENYTAVEIATDRERQLVYFNFQPELKYGMLPFQLLNEKSDNRIIQAKHIYRKYDWIAAIRSLKGQTLKQFYLEERTTVHKNVPPEFSFFVSLNTHVHTGLRFDPRYFPRTSGIYWLRDEFGEITRIGEADNLQAQLYSHSGGQGIRPKVFDYEIETDNVKRRKKAQQYIGDFIQAHGRPPRSNPIMLSKEKKKSTDKED